MAQQHPNSSNATGHVKLVQRKRVDRSGTSNTGSPTGGR